MTDTDDIEELQDKLHDLTIDLREANRDLGDAGKENERLQAELVKIYADEDSISHKLELIEVLKRDAETRNIKLESLQFELSNIRRDKVLLSDCYLKALAIIETVRMNGFNNWKYFETTDGVDSLHWAHEQHRKETDKFLTRLSGIQSGVRS